MNSPVRRFAAWIGPPSSRARRFPAPRSPVFALAALLAAFLFGTLASPAGASIPATPSWPSGFSMAWVFAAADSGAPPDSGGSELIFESARGDSFGAGEEPLDFELTLGEEDEWLRAPFGDNLLTDRDAWRGHDYHRHRTDFELDYNRVDRLRLGAHAEYQSRDDMYPRLGARIGYAFDRDRTLYGVQLEQPLLKPGRLALGFSMVRSTDHSDLQQVDDLENTLALLFFRQDFRDYFEREGWGTYLAWRVPDFSTVSVHLRNDTYRTLPTQWGTRSWFCRDRDLRPNPEIDDGDLNSVIVRLERLAHRTRRMRNGFYHWIEYERAGGSLGGDFGYSRMLADGRTVLKLSPATTLAVRTVAGSGWNGVVPSQKEFTVGGVDGLRAHEFAQYRGAQMALAQAEYTLSLWELDHRGFQGGLQALAFVDVGRAWTSPDGNWDLVNQHLDTDAGFGLATSNNGMRVYFAKNLKEPDSDVVVSLRLQQPF